MVVVVVVVVVVVGSAKRCSDCDSAATAGQCAQHPRALDLARVRQRVLIQQ